MIEGHDVLTIAKIAHEANRAYCLSVGDDSQLPWLEAPEWQKVSAINGVRFHIANPTANAEQSHVNWMADKKADGWSYGPEKDAVNKKHPCFIPYKELPEVHRVKDHIFRSVVHGCISAAGGF